MNLPEPIQSYFEADARGDGAALAQTFAADAIVHDEGQTHQGPEAIRAWWQKAKADYAATATPLEQSVTERGSVVRAEVTGTFPGSPAVLTFTFALAGDRISRLEIRG
ncbi:nuclear transport factor 2 family protein [Salipiger marinus]|uniref:nuclear transport factor 2 family protein n=1 Tax=Salipiger marinus TaxID=555512 RepID=UPI0040586B53